MLLVAGVHAGIGLAHADVPTAEDIAACNQEAREGVHGRVAAPTSKDVVGAVAARKADLETAKGSGPLAVVTQSPDPQVHGMDGEGAKDAAYRAIYRVCMRRNGF
jgi:hypothetical protein